MDAELRKVLTLDNLLDHFPWQLHQEIRPNQREALELIAKNGSMALELPTGSGKTAVGYTVLRTLADANMGPLFYITPNKTLVDEVRKMHPDMIEVYGRNEYDCLYYQPEETLKADEIPCVSLLDCSHRVDQETGLTVGEGASPCPYYTARYRAKQSQIVVCTASFYLFTHLFNKNADQPAGLVIDEAHEMANIVRNSLSYEITDYHLKQAVKVLKAIGADEEAEQLQYFLTTMIDILNRKSWVIPTLLEEVELQILIDALKGIDGSKLRSRLTEAIREGLIDTRKERVMLKRLESITFDLHRYIRAFEFSLPGEGRNPLNFVTYAEGKRARNDGGRVEYRLIIKAYYVAPLVKKLMSPLTVAYSATVGDAEIFGYETGIKLPFVSLPGNFPASNTLVVMPKDTPDLAAAKRIKAEPTKVLRRMARICKSLGDNEIRSLVVVISNKERESFLRMCAEEGVEAISYLNGSTPKEAVAQFKSGEGQVLVGTSANYGQGIDLPGEMAPVAFFLRPGYPNPKDPTTQFEVRRFGKGQCWQVWRWRAMIEALQVRGRNVRSSNDRGATIFISQGFRGFLHASLPVWLKESYRGDLTLEQAKEEILELLK